MTSISSTLDALHRNEVDPDLLWHVGELLTRWFTEKSGGRMEGYGPEVMDVAMDATDIEALHAALRALVDPDLAHPRASTIVWLIGKLARPGDRHLFDRALERGLAGDDDLLYQALIALDNLNVLDAETTSFAAFEIEKNRTLARAYLGRTAQK